jgi:hypothetical protein
LAQTAELPDREHRQEFQFVLAFPVVASAQLPAVAAFEA